MALPVPSLGSLAKGVGQILGRTLFIQPNTATGIPVPLAVLDVVKDEVVEYDAEIAEHPVEAGPEVSDHSQKKNPTIRLKGTISNTPLDLSVAIANIAAGGLAAISSAQARSNLLNSAVTQAVGIAGATLQGNASIIGGSVFAGAVDAVSRTILQYVFESGTPFSVMTKRATYKNVIIQRLRFPRNEHTGFSLDFEIDLKQIRIVSPLKILKNSVSEDVISTASSSTSLGSQATDTASPQIEQAVQKTSLGTDPAVAGKSPSFFGVA